MIFVDAFAVGDAFGCETTALGRCSAFGELKPAVFPARLPPEIPFPGAPPAVVRCFRVIGGTVRLPYASGTRASPIA